jgi:serine/threonine protein kinase
VSANVETTGFVGRVLGGRWVVGEPLGSGSFGVVHAGVERGTGNAVAVKLLHPQFLHHGETIARFWNEAEALRRMNHPNVLVLLDVGVSEDGVPYLVTELLTGETLRDLLNREGPLPAERAMRLLGPAAHALHHAHLAGIVHRDLKPENIFRVRKDGMGTTKILDFGVAKLLDTSPGRKLSQTGIMIGTMAYSPPEQMQGLGDIDHRADQFGFAALFFEALTGQRPFPQAQPFALFQAVMSGPRPRASEVRPGVPPSVDDVLIRALDPDRTKRFRTVEEFYLALSAALTTTAAAGMSTTFSGAKPIPLPNPNAPLPQPMFPPPAQAPSSGYGPHNYEASMRFRPIDEELTRSELSAADQRQQSHPLNTTLDTGSRPEMPGLHTTLVEGKTPQHIVEAIQSTAPPSMSSPPASAERPISRLQPEEPATLAQEASKSSPRGAYIAVIGIVAMAIVIALFILLRHH